jgi:hypothetical protein
VPTILPFTRQFQIPGMKLRPVISTTFPVSFSFTNCPPLNLRRGSLLRAAVTGAPAYLHSHRWATRHETSLGIFSATVYEATSIARARERTHPSAPPNWARTRLRSYRIPLCRERPSRPRMERRACKLARNQQSSVVSRSSSPPLLRRSVIKTLHRNLPRVLNRDPLHTQVHPDN